MPESFIRNILVMVLIASPVALAIVLTHFHNVKNLGSGLARLCVSRQLGLLALLLLCNLGASTVRDAAGQQAMQVVTFFVFGLVGGLLLITALRQRHTPPAVIDLSNGQTPPAVVIAALGLATFGSLILALYTPESRELVLTFAISCLLLAGASILSRRDKILVTEDGLYFHQSLIKWPRIKRLAWAEYRKDAATLVIQIAGRPFLFNVEEIRIAADKQEAVNQFLASRVAANVLS